jgi:hypothetical protein
LQPGVRSSPRGHWSLPEGPSTDGHRLRRGLHPELLARPPSGRVGAGPENALLREPSGYGVSRFERNRGWVGTLTGVGPGLCGLRWLGREGWPGRVPRPNGASPASRSCPPQRSPLTAPLPVAVSLTSLLPAPEARLWLSSGATIPSRARLPFFALFSCDDTRIAALRTSTQTNVGDLMRGFASLSATTTSCVRPVASRRRIARPGGRLGVDICKILYANFAE